MIDRTARLQVARQNRHAPLVAESLLAALHAEIQSWTCDPRRRREAWAATTSLVTESLVGECGSVQQWWEAVESKWPANRRAWRSRAGDRPVRATELDARRRGTN
ncbi:hypothetical protein I547_7701 [Mycobacterium kansasii 824]|nr:hypothetical protein I547_7701 [Mycobacterium kansasii 824]